MKPEMGGEAARALLRSQAMEAGVWDAVERTVERIPTERWRFWIAFMKTGRSLMFAYVRLKSLMFGYFEKKYFFPALWSSFARTQWVGGVSEMEYWSFGGRCKRRRAMGGAELRGNNLASQARHKSDTPSGLFAGAKRYGLLREKSAKVREVSRKFAQIRAVVWLPKPATRWVPRRVVRWRETWSRCYALLRVGPIF